MEDSLDKILSDCTKQQIVDCEGDRTYTVHIKKARDLIKRAYFIGKMEAIKRSQEIINETFEEFKDR